MQSCDVLGSLNTEHANQPNISKNLVASLNCIVIHNRLLLLETMKCDPCFVLEGALS